MSAMCQPVGVGGTTPRWVVADFVPRNLEGEHITSASFGRAACLNLGPCSRAAWAVLLVCAALAAANPGPASWAAGASNSFNVREAGATGDGLALDTAAINLVITNCSARGGGVVVFPPGRYLSGTVRLQSGVTLLLESGAALIGATNLAHYQEYQPPPDTPEGRFRSHWHRALILGVGVTNVAIVGPGLIDGHKVFDPQGEERMRGPHTILLGDSREIVFRDFSIHDSANYAVMLENCQQVQARNLRITGGWDGLHFRGWPGRPCRDVSILGCQFYTGDDAIAGRYWENVLISDCIINSACNGIRLIGPANHLIIQNCLFYGPGVHPHRTSNRFNMLAGINLQPGAWDATAGTLDDVLISDVTLHRVTTPFHFMLKPGNTAGRITVSRASATAVYRAAASVESWAGTPFTNVVFRDVTIDYEGGGKPGEVPLTVRSPGVDARPLPSWGFYARGVENLVLDNVRLHCLKDDLRPVLIADQVGRLTFEGFRFPGVKGADGPLLLTNVAEVITRDAGAAPTAR
jgi:hypothetical protein